MKGEVSTWAGPKWTAVPDRETTGSGVAVAAKNGPVLVAAECGKTDTTLPTPDFAVSGRGSEVGLRL